MYAPHDPSKTATSDRLHAYSSRLVISPTLEVDGKGMSMLMLLIGDSLMGPSMCSNVGWWRLVGEIVWREGLLLMHAERIGALEGLVLVHLLR